MKIAIAQKLRPFSHTPGMACLIPGTCSIIEAFPTFLRFHNFEYAIDVKGPVKGFTLLQDLEKNCVFIFGKPQEKFYRFRLVASEGGFTLFSEKTKERHFFAAPIEFYIPPIWERLSLGSHKAQDWDLVTRRFDLKEILPVLFGLGQKIPLIAPQPFIGTGRLLNANHLENFCRVAFSQILIPRLKDEQHLGLVPNTSVSGNPCFLLQEAVKLIRSLFFFQNERRLDFLPTTLFAEGRFNRIQAAGVGEIDLEWASQRIRRVVIRASQSGEVVLKFSKEVRAFRTTSSVSIKGKKTLRDEPLVLVSGNTYCLDNFQFDFTG